MRQGQNGKAYSNRSDLNAARAMLSETPRGGQYGSRKASEDARKMVPMGTTQVPDAPMESAAPQPAMPRPVSLTEPTQFPDEDIRTGMNNMMNTMPPDTMAEDMQKLRSYLPMIQIAAESEDSPQVLRDFVNYLRGM
jgi:predicted lipid-binding transport protein (Tim44 family)